VNRQVDAENDRRLRLINADNHHFDAIDTPGREENGWQVPPKRATELLDDQTRWPASLDLRVGATVMLVVVSRLECCRSCQC
jgi:hypothetical protein